MAFEKVTLAVAEDSGIDHAYFAYGTMWAPASDNIIENLIKFQAVYPDTIVNLAGDEFAVDFVEPGAGRPVCQWDFITV